MQNLKTDTNKSLDTETKSPESAEQNTSHDAAADLTAPEKKDSPSEGTAELAVPEGHTAPEVQTVEQTAAPHESGEHIHHKAVKPQARAGTRRRYRHFKPFHHLTRKEKKRQLRVGFVMLIVMLLITVAFIWKDYHERPGILERSSLRQVEAGTDTLTIEWKGTRNTDSYTVYYKPEGESPLGWRKVTIANEKGHKDSVTLKNLEEGTRYGIIIRADNEERTGFSTEEKFFSTRRTQTIDGQKHYTKLTCSSSFDLGLKAETRLSYKSSDKDVVKVSKKGKVTITGSGTAKITATAAETKEFLGDEFETEIEVIGTDAVSAGGAAAHIIYNLSADNCEPIMTVTGADGATVPQAFGYTGEEYIIAYGMSGSQRIVSFNKEGEKVNVSVPDVALGHPNGFAYANSNGTCYCVKGWTGRCVTYKPDTGEYGVITFPYGASGIGYDREKDLIYTSSRTAMIAYSIGEDGYEIQSRCGVVSHSGHTYTQDCGGHAGIMMRCLSGSSKHGTNYVDLYDMEHGLYLGTIACELSEVESATVDDDGYMLLLSNTSGNEDIIWRTPLNIGDIGAGLRN